MKKAPIAVALVLVFGLFAAALSLTPAIAQYGTTPSSTSTAGSTSSASNTTAGGNTTTSSTGNTTSSNSTSTGSTFSARGTIATLIFDTGSSTTTNQTATPSTNTTSTGNMTSSGNTTSAGNTTMGQTMVGGNSSTNATGNTIGTNTTTSSTGNTTASSSNTTSTASKLDQPYIVSGDWSLSVQNGNVSSFKANMTMVHIDGTGRHTHEVTNFKMSNGSMVQLPQNGTTLIFGTADVSANGSPKWTGVNTLIMIEKFNAVAISFSSEQTDDHFHGQPLYGVVHSLTQDGKEMVQTGSTQTSSNSTGNAITQGAQNMANQTGNALNNLTQGIKNFFNSTK